MANKSAIFLALTIAAASVGSSFGQNAYVAAAGGSYTQADPAPIERGQSGAGNYGPQGGYNSPQDGAPQQPEVMATHPAQGVTVRADRATEVKVIAADAHHTELRLERGVANVIVRDPAPDALVLVDLPGGQTQLLKNGFYTFNAGTNTARVFSGEADAFANANDKPMHVKGGDQVVFTAGKARISYSDPYNARADVLPGSMGGPNRGEEQGYDRGYGPSDYGEPAYAYGNGYYGGGYAPYVAYGDYPYYAYGYPYGYYGYGYPYFGYGLGFGIGFGGYYGGYRGGYGYGGGYGGRGYPGGGIGVHPGGVSGGSFHGGSVGGGGGRR